jgi:ubiquinone/menaquinone biosynthesis C-methylase UbiE
VKTNNYNFIAPLYDSLVRLVFGRAVFQAQMAFIQQLPDQAEVLFVGGGSGQVLQAILKQKPQLKITYLEQSKKMLALSQKKVSKTHKVDFIAGDLSQLPVNKFDAVLTFFFFDIFKAEEGTSIFNQIDQQLKTKGLWFIADFLPPQKRKHQILEKMMYAFLCISTNIATARIPKLQKLFAKQSFKLLKEKKFYDGFIFSACYQKLGNDS